MFAVLQSRNSIYQHYENNTEVLRRIMTDPGYSPDHEVTIRHSILHKGRHRSVVFQAFLPLKQDMMTAFTSIAPVEQNDTVVPIDYRTIAFIREIRGQTEDELTDLSEFADAVIGTMEGEGIGGIRAGIGRELSELKGLRNSYLDGVEALKLGVKYSPNENVYVYQKQMLERILESIPPEKKNEIRREVMAHSTSGELSDEMMETVSAFFRNDLNLSAASKQLFIHRNTLNYRLDKIRKETGLDLRSFRDAVIFCIASTVPEDRSKSN